MATRALVTDQEADQLLREAQDAAYRLPAGMEAHSASIERLLVRSRRRAASVAAAVRDR